MFGVFKALRRLHFFKNHDIDLIQSIKDAVHKYFIPQHAVME